MPVAMSRNPGLDFSFSGLKTAVLYRCRDLGPEGVQERRADLAASFQAAVVGQLTTKLKRALKKGEWEAVALGGGVAANGPLREAVGRLCEEMGVRLKLVPIALCTDNAAMIGSAARYVQPIPYPDYLGYDAFASGETGGPRSPTEPRWPTSSSTPVRAATSARRRSTQIVALHGEGYRFDLHEVDIESNDLLLRRHLERIPVVEVDGIEVSELILDRDALSRPGSILWGHGRGDRGVRRRRGVPGRRRATVAGRRRAALPLPAGADPGAEDGPRDDLLAGALRVHPHQPDPDPPRPLRLRQVRQARGRLQRRLAGLGDPQDPPHLRPAQHRPLRRRQPRPGDRHLLDLRRPRLPGRRGLRQSTRAWSATRSAS